MRSERARKPRLAIGSPRKGPALSRANARQEFLIARQNSTPKNRGANTLPALLQVEGAPFRTPDTAPDPAGRVGARITTAEPSSPAMDAEGGFSGLFESPSERLCPNRRVG